MKAASEKPYILVEVHDGLLSNRRLGARGIGHDSVAYLRLTDIGELLSSIFARGYNLGWLSQITSSPVT